VGQDLARAGHANEPVMFVVSTDSPMNLATGEVVADSLRKAGPNIDYRAMDFGTVMQRRLQPEPVAQGGWNGYCSGASGLAEVIPPTHVMLRGNGMSAPNIGWPTSPGTERLRAAWLDAPDLPVRKAIAEQLQLQALQDVPYMPLVRCCSTVPTTRPSPGC
jgi:peptide/nickel transport system substrate-binding protein